MNDTPPPLHTGRDDCQCRDCFWRIDRPRYWTTNPIPEEKAE